MAELRLQQFAESPAMAARLAFFETADQLKEVLRRSQITSGRRRENSAEHSWHLALMAMIFAPIAPVGADLDRVRELLLVHDLVEIDAGDTFCYDEVAALDKEAREQRAAERIFGLLPAAEGNRMRELWDEFEAKNTLESRFANALDRLQPLLLNTANKGRLWQENGVRRSQVMARNQHIADGSPELWQLARNLIENACRNGWLIDDHELPPTET